MVDVLIDWLLGFIQELVKFNDWLVTPLQYLGIPPLFIFSFAGITVIVGFLVIRLVVGG